MQTCAAHTCLLVHRLWRQRTAVWTSITRDCDDRAFDYVVRVFYSGRKYGVADLSMPARLQSLPEGSRLCASEGALPPLPSELRTEVLKCVFLRLICNCTVDPVSAILVFSRVGEINWATPDFIGWLLYAFKNTTIISVPEL